MGPRMLQYQAPEHFVVLDKHKALDIISNTEFVMQPLFAPRSDEKWFAYCGVLEGGVFVGIGFNCEFIPEWKGNRVIIIQQKHFEPDGKVTETYYVDPHYLK